VSSVSGFSDICLCGCVTGHSEAVLSVQFSPDSRMLASGSGDTTVRFWDIYTQTPLFTCTGKVWLLVLNSCFFHCM
jgi:WD40 repeat protein